MHPCTTARIRGEPCPDRRRLAFLLLALSLGSCSGGNSTTGFPTAPSGGQSINPASLAGSYTLTITASRSCASRLPTVARERTFNATLTASSTGVGVNLTGRGGFFQGEISTLTNIPAAGQISFTFVISEFVNDIEVYDVNGGGTGTLDGGRIVGRLNGQVQFNGLTNGSCTAADHDFVFSRR